MEKVERMYLKIHRVSGKGISARERDSPKVDTADGGSSNFPSRLPIEALLTRKAYHSSEAPFSAVNSTSAEIYSSLFPSICGISRRRRGGSPMITRKDRCLFSVNSQRDTPRSNGSLFLESKLCGIPGIEWRVEVKAEERAEFKLKTSTIALSKAGCSTLPDVRDAFLSSKKRRRSSSRGKNANR